MRILHLNTHASGGSYEYAALLSSALAEQGIESHVLCKSTPSAGLGRLFLDRIVRRSYVSLSTEPWHGTRRLLSPPGPEELNGRGPSAHGSRLVRRSALARDAAAQNECRDQHPRYVARDRRLLSLSWMRSLRQPDTPLRSMSDLEMACKPIPGKHCAFAETAGISKLWSTHGCKQSLAG